MNKKIKVIDLINIIAKNQDIPQRIRVDKDIYNWDIEEFYKREDGKDLFVLADFYNTIGFLELEVEILEDNTEEIEELDRNLKFDDLITPYGKNEDMMWTEIIKQHNKIDEIIRYIKRKDKSND